MNALKKKNRFFTLVMVAALGVIVFISFLNLKSTFFHSAVILKDTQKPIIAIGKNNYGQLGVKPDGDAFSRYQPEVPADIVQIAAGRTHSLVLTKNGKVWVWGGNDWKQLGLQVDMLHQAKPQENLMLSDVRSVSASNNHSLVLKRDGSVLAFGSNFSGQLGTGDNQDLDVPTKVKNIDNVSQVAAGYKFSVALKEDGSVWGWGASCDNSTRRQAEEWWKNMLSNMTNLEGGYYDAAGDAMVTFDKNEYCINEDIVGILSKVPRKIERLEHITAISAGYGHILALDEKGSVWSSGCNTYQQLGRKTEKKVDNTTPEMVKGLPRINEISAGYRHSLVLTEDGVVYGWGQNSHGQLGTGDLVDTIEPVKIPIDHVSQIIAGYDFSFAIKEDGSVWGWGRNAGGWFGDTDIELVNTPQKLNDLNNVVQIAAGGMFILALSK